MQTKHYQIVAKKDLASNITQFTLNAPLIAQRCQPGQFVVVRLDEQGERIPLTIAKFDREAGTITLVVQNAGRTTAQFISLNAGDTVEDVLGPLGQPTPLSPVGTVVCVGGGVGIALLYPIARAHHQLGNRVLSIMGSRTKDLLFFQQEMAQVSDKVYYATDDGSFGHHGFVTDVLAQILESGEEINQVVAIGPLVMMKAVSNTTRPYGVSTIVSLNPIMVDGTGMCGGCRVKVGNETRFACVDGPDFDGHQVDFDELLQRQQRFAPEEKVCAECWEEHASTR